MSLADIRTFVRGVTDLDSTDLPDAILDPMIRDVHYKWTNASRVWSFYAVEKTLPTVSGTQTYLLSDPSLVTTVGASAMALRDLSSVTGPHWQVKPIPHEMARKRYPTLWLYKGEPAFWSIYGSTLYFWPIPNAVYSLTVVGYRAPQTIASSGDQPDLPSEFHEPLSLAVVGHAFAQQEDFEGANWYTQLADNRFATLKDQYTDTSVAVPTVLNGGTDAYQEFSLPDRLRYTWEK